MEWWLVLVVTILVLMVLFASGLPVAFGFLTFNIIGAMVWMGGESGLRLLTTSIFSNIATFVYIAVPMFVLMGEVLFQTGLAGMMIDHLGKWVGRIPGSLSVLAILSGTVFAMMSGSAISGVALLGSTLVPEMKRRGYSTQMSIGPILGAGSLAVLIPPSIFAVLLAALARISVGKLLIAGIIPGLVLASLFLLYILIRARLQPNLAPTFAPARVSWGEKGKSLALMLPMGLLIFLVLGLMFLGVAAPSEASALGAVGAVILTLAYRKLNWLAVKKSMIGTLIVTGMVFMILANSETFSQILAFTGATGALVTLATGLSVSGIMVIIIMQLLLLVLGCFIDAVSIMMITVPIFFPVILALGFDPIWFGALMVVNLELGTITPPFGMALFTMKGVSPDVSTGEIWRAGAPFFLLGVALLVLILVVPSIATWLPGLMWRG